MNGKSVSMSKRKLGDPQFLSRKFKIQKSSLNKNVFDFQLQDHFLNKCNLYILQCKCSSHKHCSEPCIIVTDQQCVKCKQATKLLIDYQSLMFHDDLALKKLTTCHAHQHSPPCKRCINCKIGLNCIVPEPFECCASTGKPQFY